ncbi:MAG: S-methyl-5-thioribose-1-phosphate isomerase [Candidatus Bathyarchaeota archaeon]|nr:S-methyl-5-thioribose-1-phosphate isomerase [Candidatus Termiticorpusculum sp.]
MEAVKATAEKICRFEVQGARNTAIAAVKTLQMLAQQSEAKNKIEFLTNLSQAQQLLFNTRETEPLMRNALHYIIDQVQQSSIQNVHELCTLLVVGADKFLSELDASREHTAEIGAKHIQNGITIFTHCHSSTATRMLTKAKQDGKNFRVICTETRPAFQGRITAREMIENGIETTFIVDSAAQTFIPKADLVIVGADAITHEGNVVNKIGTSGLAILAYEARKPFYVVSELLKFDPITSYNALEGIEQRNPAEVWKESPKELDVRNPAFDVTPSRYIHGLICEKGIIPLKNMPEIMQQFYPWLYKQSSPNLHVNQKTP